MLYGSKLSRREREMLSRREGFAVRVILIGGRRIPDGIIAVCATHRGAARIANRDRGRFERCVIEPLSP